MGTPLQPYDEAGSRQSTEDERRDFRFRAVAEAFLELSELLEDYAPVWYTERHRERVMAARKALQNRKNGASLGH